MTKKNGIIHKKEHDRPQGFKPGQSGNKIGRPVGAKDKVPRGSIRLAFLDFMKHCGGRVKMMNAIDRAITKQDKLGLGYMRLGAQVIDRIDHERKLLGQGATVIFHSPIDPLTLRMGLAAPETEAEDPDDDG